MRKLLMVAVLVLMLSGVVFADNQKTYVIRNTSGAYLTTTIPILSIVPNRDRVLGFTVQGINSQSENVIAVYDETLGNLTGECIGECEAQPDTINGILLPKGKIPVNGITVRQGPGTITIVYFEV